MRRLWRSGEPFIWLTGGALATALVMVGGLLAIIVVNAAGFFWPAEIVRLTLTDDTVLTGPVAERERIPGAGDAWRVKIKVANRDLYGADFVWVDESAVARRERPPDVAVVERTEWGLLIGTIAALKEGGALVASGPAAWPEIERRLPAAAALRGQIRKIEKSDIGAINYEQEQIRLRLRRLESRGATDGPEVAQLQAALAELEERYKAQAATLSALRATQTTTMVVAADGGKEKELPLAQVIDVTFPNTMPLAAKALSITWLLARSPRFQAPPCTSSSAGKGPSPLG